MKRYLKSLSALLLAIVIIVTSYVPIFAVGQPTKYSSSYNSGQRDVVCTTLDGTSADSYYYGSYEYDVLSEKSASEIKSSLKSLMTSTHTYRSSYNDCHYKADRTDCENGDGSVSLIYTSYSATMDQWNGWNREHVWPQSLGGGNTNGGGADLHHIRPSDAVVNSTRGNKKYGYAPGGTAKYGSTPAIGYLGGTYNSTYFEPLDNVKGDVARICLYVYVRWGSDWGADSVTKVFQSVDVLLEWCALDPVDTWEMGRNEVVQDIQGNRNVFIDYPEYAWLIFGEEVPEDMVTPSGKAADGNTNSGNNNGNVDDPVIPDNPVVPPVCNHTNTELRGEVHEDCIHDGYTGDVYCADCDKRLEYGSQVQPNGVHSYGDWVLPDGGSYKRYCVVCDAFESITIDAVLTENDDETEKIIFLLSLGITDSALLESIFK